MSFKTNFIIFDLEYTYSKKYPNNEIIEIGAVRFDNEKSIENVAYFQRMMKPNVPINENVESITGITNQMVENCSFFPKNIKKFIKWIGVGRCIFVTWGDGDCQILIDNCRFHKIDSTWLEWHIDLQKVFMDVNSIKTPISLSNALKMCNINTPHEHHRALKDAFNTTIILIELSKKCNVKDYMSRIVRKQLLLNKKKNDFNEYGKKVFETLISLEIENLNRKGRNLTWERLIKGLHFKNFYNYYNVDLDTLNIMMKNFDLFKRRLIKKYKK